MTWGESMRVTIHDISDAINRLGLANQVVCLHSSIKSFGYVEGGAPTIFEAFLKKGCTLLVPTFYYHAIVPPPVDRRIPQNGYDYARMEDCRFDDVEAYLGADTMIDKSMGAIPAALLRRTDKVRGNHPICSFAGIGPEAQIILKTQTPLAVYAPYQAIYKRTDARLLLMGVDLTKATPIHFAEQLSGRRLFRRWAKTSETEVVETEVGGCSDGFNHLAPYVSTIEQSVRVGESLWRSFPFQGFVDGIIEAIRSDDSITHCGNKDCERCNDAVQGGPLL